MNVKRRLVLTTLFFGIYIIGLAIGNMTGDKSSADVDVIVRYVVPFVLGFTFWPLSYYVWKMFEK